MASPSVKTMRDELWAFVTEGIEVIGEDIPQEDVQKKKKEISDLKETLVSNSGTGNEDLIISVLYKEKKEDIQKMKVEYGKNQKGIKWKRHCADCDYYGYYHEIHHPELFNDVILDKYNRGRVHFDRRAAEQK